MRLEAGYRLGLIIAEHMPERLCERRLVDLIQVAKRQLCDVDQAVPYIASIFSDADFHGLYHSYHHPTPSQQDLAPQAIDEEGMLTYRP